MSDSSSENDENQISTSKKEKKIDISSLNKKKIYSQEPEEINDNPKKIH